MATGHKWSQSFWLLPNFTLNCSHAPKSEEFREVWFKMIRRSNGVLYFNSCSCSYELNRLLLHSPNANQKCRIWLTPVSIIEYPTSPLISSWFHFYSTFPPLPTQRTMLLHYFTCSSSAPIATLRKILGDINSTFPYQTTSTSYSFAILAAIPLKNTVVQCYSSPWCLSSVYVNPTKKHP